MGTDISGKITVAFGCGLLVVGLLSFEPGGGSARAEALMFTAIGAGTLVFLLGIVARMGGIARTLSVLLASLIAGAAIAMHLPSLRPLARALEQGGHIALGSLLPAVIVGLATLYLAAAVQQWLRPVDPVEEILRHSAEHFRVDAIRERITEGRQRRA